MLSFIYRRAYYHSLRSLSHQCRFFDGALFTSTRYVARDAPPSLPLLFSSPSSSPSSSSSSLSFVTESEKRREDGSVPLFSLEEEQSPKRGGATTSQTSLPSSPSSSPSPSPVIITPWRVAAQDNKGFDYTRVRELFKAQEVTAETLQQLVSAMPHKNVCRTPSRYHEAHGTEGFPPPSSCSTTTTSSFPPPAPPPQILKEADAGERVHGRKPSLPSSSPSSSSSVAMDKLHPFFTRGIVFAHRDLDKALARLALHRTTSAVSSLSSSPSFCEVYPSGHLHPPPPAYLYTGRGPSSASMHLGHSIPFALTCYLQHALQLPVVIQITDDEKYLFRDFSFSDEEGEKRIRDNIKDIIAFGFHPDHTFVFRNTTYMGQLYPTVLALQRAMTTGAVRHTLGLLDSDNVGKLAFPATQAAPCFATCFPGILYPAGTTTDAAHHCHHHHSDDHNDDRSRVGRREALHPFPIPQCIIPCAVDQDPFFVLARHAARRLPLSLTYRFFPWLRDTISSSPRRNKKNLKREIKGNEQNDMNDHSQNSSSLPPSPASSVIPPPATLYTTFLPSLRGPSSKMSSSSSHAGKEIIFLTDPPDVVRRKLRKAFSGGAPTLEAMKRGGGGDDDGNNNNNNDHHRGGVDLDVDVAFQLLRFFMREEEVWRGVGRRYQRGEIHSGDIKALCALTLEEELLSDWQRRRAAVTDEDVEQFCRVRPIW